MAIPDMKNSSFEPFARFSSGEPSPRQTVSGIMLLVYWILLFLGTHLPSIDVGVAAPHHDKFLHVTAFTGLAVLLSWFVLGLKPVTKRSCFIILAVLLSYGAFDELTQLEVTGRTTDIWDFCADVLGSVLGLSCYLTATTVVRGLISQQSRPS